MKEDDLAAELSVLRKPIKVSNVFRCFRRIFRSSKKDEKIYKPYIESIEMGLSIAKYDVFLSVR